MRRGPLSGKEHHARMRVCRAVVAEKGSLREAARRIGISPGGLCKWLGDHDRDLRTKLAEKGNLMRSRPLGEAATVRRIERVYCLGQLGAARREKISPQAMSQWLARNVPEGVEAYLRESGVI